MDACMPDHEQVHHGHWADLPPELLTLVLVAAHKQLCAPPCCTGSEPEGVPQCGQLPSLAQAAALSLASEATCRSWQAGAVAARGAASLSVAVGRTALPATGDAAKSLRRWLGVRPVAALHFETSHRPGCSPGAIQALAVDLLASDDLTQSSAASLVELAVWGFASSRPLCALLPRFAMLRSLALTGYSVDLDLEPLRALHHLAALHVEAECLPRLASLGGASSLRHLSLSCFANPARVLLPRGLLLESLDVRCPSQGVFLGLDRAIKQCRRVHVSGAALHLLLHVPFGTPTAAAAARTPHAVLLSEFGSARVQRLLLEAPAQQVKLKLAAQATEEQPADVVAAVVPPGPAVRLDAGAVCASAAALPGITACLTDRAQLGEPGCGAGTGVRMQGLLLVKPGGK